MTSVIDHLTARGNHLGADLRNANHAQGDTAAGGIETATPTDASSYRCRVPQVCHGATNQPIDGQIYS